LERRQKKHQQNPAGFYFKSQRLKMGKTVFVLPKNQFEIFLFLKFSCNPTVNGLGCFYVNELFDLEKPVLFFL
jgi:hypothetical protein